MPLRIAVTKVVGNNEQMVFDIAQWNPVTGDIMHDSVEEMHDLLNEAVKFADVRALELDTRMLEGYELRKYCTPAEWTKLLDILEVVTGKQDISTIARRWQSAVEETADLESARLQAAYKQRVLEESARLGNIYDGKEY